MSAPRPSKTGTGNKRKRQPPPQQEPSRKRGRVSIHEARAIAAQTSGKAFGNGEIDVDKFVKSREFEIKALEQGMKNAKNTLAERAFQSVPRELRRRTASHNVKRVPRRLRARAAREMKEDNTPTVTARRRKPKPRLRLRIDIAKRLKELEVRDLRKKKAAKDERSKQKQKQKLEPQVDTANIEADPDGSRTSEADVIVEVATQKEENTAFTIVSREPRIKRSTLQKPPKPKAKFRKRQIHKAWLPTHMFHAKRAHMTPPKEPLWRMAIPLSPTVKSYRPTHRATTLRGAVAWDMSYISTIGLEGPEKSIVGLMKALGVGKDEPAGFWEKRASRWLRGSRYWHGWLYEREAYPNQSIASVTVVWCASGETTTTNVLENDVHDKKQKKDKRKAFIRVHPSAFLQLWEEVLKISKVQKPAVAVEDLRFEIGSIDIAGPACTEVLTGLLQPSSSDQNSTAESASIVWPRLRNVASPANLPANVLLAFTVTDPRLNHNTKAIAVGHDVEEQNQLLQLLATWPPDKSQLASDIFSRSARMAASRQLPSQKAINRRKALAGPGEGIKPSSGDPKIPIMLIASYDPGHTAGRWTVLLPWKCVLPVWYSLMYCPLSTGGTVRFGGLDQLRQCAFEAGIAWFPSDFPGTAAGMSWEMKERDKRKAAWQRKPKGRRIEFDTLKLGNQRTGEVGTGWACDWEILMAPGKMADSSQSMYRRVPIAAATQLLSRARKTKPAENQDSAAHASGSETHETGLITVKVTYLGRGVPVTCARIYRLPMDDKALHEQWISLIPQSKAKNSQQQHNPKLPKNAPSHDIQQHLAASLLNAPTTAAEKSPDIPGMQDLMGFITTGNFNLQEGRGTGLGCISLEKVLQYKRWKSEGYPNAPRCDENVCIVREAGQSLGRLAKWEMV